MAPSPRIHAVPAVDGDVAGLRDGAVVISGMAGLYPNALNVKELSKILYNKINPVSANDTRWEYNHPELRHHTGKLPELQRFDAQFFKVHYWLAINMDPMGRKILEQAFHAIYDAGVNPEHLSGKKIGVYIGTCLSETEKATFYLTTSKTGFGITGCSKTMFANRISYWLNAKGPSMSLDESCCSSTAAVELAYQAIMKGECEAAIVGGTNLCLHPQSSVHYGRIVKLSENGETRSYDENADGFAKSEAINVLFLQKAKDALRVYAEIVYVKNEFTELLKKEDGDTQYGFNRTTENSIKFLKDFYSKTPVPPQAVEYVEGCGSAIPEADKVELETFDEIFCKGRDEPLMIGSVMSNVGYGEAASGITAITKVVLGYYTGALAGNLHCAAPRRDVAALRDGRMRVLRARTPFRRQYAAVNQLSVTGVNAHVLLKGHYKPKDPNRYLSAIPHLALISGRHESAVTKVLDDLESRPIDPEELALLGNFHGTRISGNLARGFIVLGKDEEGQTVALSKKVNYFDYVKRPLWFVYSGMGSQWAGMGKELMRIPVFAAVIQRCHRVLEPKGVNLVEIITSTNKEIFDNILHSFIGITAIQIGLTDVLTELGVVPDKIIGHSLGEMGCAYVDGCLSAEEAILCAYGRGLVSVQTPFIRGAMAAVGVGYKDIIEMCPPEIEVACHNSHNSCTISGPEANMTEFIKLLSSKDIYVKEVPCSNIAYHSRYIADAGPGLLKFLRSVIKSPKLRSERWVSTSVPMDKWDRESARYSSAEYHTNNLLSPVLFEETSRLIPSDAVLVEVAPHALLQAILKRALPASCKNIPLTRRDHPDSVLYLLEAIGALYIEGFSPDIKNLYPKIEFPVSTETPMLSHLVEWAHGEKWPLPMFLSGRRKYAAAATYVISLHEKEHAYLKDHVVRGKTVLPFAAALVAVWDTLAMAAGAAGAAGGARAAPVRLRDVALHAQPVLHARRQLRLTVRLQRGTGNFEVLDDLDSKVASGFITLEENDSDVPSIPDSEVKDSDMNITSEEIYNQFYLKDVCYGDSFQSIHSANPSLTEARIQWRDNWVTFIDGLIQLNALRHSNDSYSEIKSISRLYINPELHSQYKENELVAAKVLKTHDIISCGGVIMQNVNYHSVPVSPLNSLIVTGKTDESHQLNGKDSTGDGQEYYLDGDLNSLQWVQGSLPTLDTEPETGLEVEVHYAGLNDLDVKRITGLIPPCTSANGNILKGYGMDFSGVTKSGMRVMGVVGQGAARSRLAARLAWPVPPHWSLEDAATVPSAYCLAYYCLVCTTVEYTLNPKMSIMIHGGAGSAGQAFISVALAYGCQVYTTVNDASVKRFLLKLFPALKPENIGSSRDLSFRDEVLTATNGKGVNLMIICDLNPDLQSFYMTTLKPLGICIDVRQIPNGEHFNLGMNFLEEEKSYRLIDFPAIFKQNRYSVMKRLQQVVAAGIACGAVVPLARVALPARHAARGVRLAAAAHARGPLLLRLRDQPLPAQPRVQCSGERTQVVVSESQCFGQRLAGWLVARGARRLRLCLPRPDKYLHLNLSEWKKIGVHVRYEMLSNTKDIQHLLNNDVPVEGVYIYISDKESASHPIFTNVDNISTKSLPQLKYFAVIRSSADHKSSISVDNSASVTKITIPELIGTSSTSDGSEGAGGWSLSAALDAVERALLAAGGEDGGERGEDRGERGERGETMLQQIAHVADINIPENDMNDTTTLSELGVTESKAQIVFAFLRDAYNVHLSNEQIKNLTIQRINIMEEKLTKTSFDDTTGLNALISSVASDELQATTDIVFLPTLTSAYLEDDEIDMKETSLFVVPGVEGLPARFGPLSAPLRLAALLLQPPLDRPHDSPRQLARAFVEILLQKARLKNKFYLLGYEMGVFVALEMAVILEEKGMTGTVFCIGAPEEITAEARKHLECYQSEEALQEAIVRHMFGLMIKGADTLDEGAFSGGRSWDERVEAGVRRLAGRVPHSTQYARLAMHAAYGRVRQLLQPQPVAAPRAPLVLLRPRPSRTGRAPQPPQPQRYAAQYQLAAPLAHATEDLRCATIINDHLDADVLDAFRKTNLCESYLTSFDTFMMTCDV